MAQGSVGTEARGGRYVRQTTGYRAFIPSPLPLDPPLRLEGELQLLLSSADRALARLDGVGSVLPDPDGFVMAYVWKEALLSSQIEGTQASLVDVLEYEIDEKNRERRVDTREVINYVLALEHGFERIDTFPLSLRLIREIHKILLEGVRGSEKDPGEFRTIQNWVGPSGSTPATASYVPPPVHEMKNALHEFEKYLCENKKDPPLIRCALAHAQFETVHPFLDGNGRIGRLLITFMLGVENILARPLLYLSYYFKRNQNEYYDMLTATRERGDWEGWVRFFLNGVIQTAEQAVETARTILDMREAHRKIASSGKLKGKNSNSLLGLLFESPIVTANHVSGVLGVSYPTAMTLCKEFEKENLLVRRPGLRRNIRFAYEPYLAILREGTEL